MNRVANISEPIQYEPRFSIWTMTIICSLLVIIIIWTIAGNVLVMVTIVTELNIKNSSNHLIFSLAVTDLFVAVAVMPLSAVKEVSINWWLGLELCDIWIFTDVLTCTASIFHLVVIAIDRYLSITKLTYNRNRSTISTTAMIAASWIAATLVSIPSRFYFQRNNRLEKIAVNYNGTCLINEGNSYTILANFLSFCFPLLIMGVVYFKIFIFIKRQTKNRKAIKNSVIGSDALSTTLPSDVCYSKSTVSPFPHSELWSSIYDDSKIIPDENSFESVATESLEKSAWINDEYSQFKFADEDEEFKLKLNIQSNEDISSKYLFCTDKSSTDSPPVSSMYLQPISVKTYSEITKQSNLAKAETFSTFQEELYPLEFRPEDILKSPNSNKSIIKLPKSNYRNLKSPTLSWSPKLTFFPCKASKSNRKSGYNTDENSSSPFALSSNYKNNNHSPIGNIHSDSVNDNSFASIALRVKRINQKREYRVVRTLFIITGLFIICWLPFGMNNLLRAYVISTPSEFGRIMDSIFLWLGYANSGLNPIIYTIFSSDFQVAFKKILCGSNCP